MHKVNYNFENGIKSLVIRMNQAVNEVTFIE